MEYSVINIWNNYNLKIINNTIIQNTRNYVNVNLSKNKKVIFIFNS